MYLVNDVTVRKIVINSWSDGITFQNYVVGHKDMFLRCRGNEIEKKEQCNFKKKELL